jgi:hypothetical protein
MKNAQSTLKEQLPALLNDLRLAQQTLRRIADIEPELYERVRRRFDEQIENRRREIEDLQEKVQGGSSLHDAWVALDETQRECRSLFAESLAYVQGALTRQAKLDDGICGLADALLDEICYHKDFPWRRITILAESDFYGNTAQIIRLGFPDTNIWNLPLAAHELGHYIGPLIETENHEGPVRLSSKPFQEMLNAAYGGSNSAAWSYLHEQFADIFATYTLGPAYPFTCIMSRFNPAFADPDEVEQPAPPRHPAPAQRVYLMLGTLRRLDQAADLRSPHPYTAVTDYLEEAWQDLVSEAGGRISLDAASQAALDKCLGELLPVVDRHLKLMRYDGFVRAKALASELRPAKGPPRVPAEAGIADVLNAAWVCRVDSNGDRDTVRSAADRAEEACRTIIDRRKAADAGD